MIECEVFERTGSQGAKCGSVIFGTFFEVNGCRQALGLSPYMLPPMSVQAVIKVRQILHKRLKTKKLTDAQVSKFDFMLSKHCTLKSRRPRRRSPPSIILPLALRAKMRCVPMQNSKMANFMKLKFPGSRSKNLRARNQPQPLCWDQCESSAKR